MSEMPAHRRVPPEPVPQAGFCTTHWSVVLEAGRVSQAEGKAALEELCRRYWYPLYAFVRKRGRNHQDAQDMVQGFLADLCARNDLASVHPDKGRFRTFLLKALTHFLANDWNRAQALKRGGGVVVESLENSEPEAEERYRHGAAVEAPAEVFYDRAWAEEILSTVLVRLRAECRDGEEKVRFEALKACLLGDSANEPYSELAKRLGLSEAGVKSAVHRFRRRFRDLFRDEIGRTVVRREDIDEELRYLVQVMTG